MGEKPIFKDCAIPADCECAKRGYELERDSCAVPGVAAAAAAVGVPSAGLFSRLFTHPVPKEAVGHGGTVQPLPNGGDLAQDVLQTIRRLASGNLAPVCPYDRDELDRIIRHGKACRGVQAEAGIGGADVEILFCSSEKLDSGVTLRTWLTLGRTDLGDALYWMVAVWEGEVPLIFGDEITAGTAVDLLQIAGGGSVGDKHASWALVPSEEDIKAVG